MPENPGRSKPLSLPHERGPSFRDLIETFAQIGLLSFGGPTAQIALMHRILVEEKRWLNESQYLNALSFCMLLPGPEAMQLATYVGWLKHGFRGGMAAGILFVLPGALVVLALAMVYASYGNVPLISTVFLGIKSAVIVIVVEALLRIAKRALKRREHWVIAAMSFIAIFFFAVPFPIIVFLAALYGFVRADTAAAQSGVSEPRPIAVSYAQTLSTILGWGAVWVIPLVLIAVFLGPDHVVSQLSLFFSKLAVVTFGGAYAVLAYMAQDVVVRFGWLDAGTMMDGLGLAETTPGPLILVTEFVGYLAAYKHGGEPAMVMGMLGAFVAIWATFVPCFLWIMAGAPYIDWITHQPRLKGALSAITAAVVGVIFNLAVWFALHVTFVDVELHRIGIAQVWTPVISSVDLRVVILAGLAGYLLLWRHWTIPPVLSVMAGLGILLHIAGA